MGAGVAGAGAGTEGAGGGEGANAEAAGVGTGDDETAEVPPAHVPVDTAAALLLHPTAEGLIGPKPPAAQNVPRARTALAVARAAEKAAKAADAKRSAEAAHQRGLAVKAKAKAAKAAKAAERCQYRDCDKPDNVARHFVQCTKCQGWWHIMCVKKLLPQRAKDAKVLFSSPLPHGCHVCMCCSMLLCAHLLC